MALSVKAGTFTLQATTGNQSITGLGFQPKAVLFFSNYRVLGESVHNIMMIGCAAGTDQWVGVYRSEDAAASPNASTVGRGDSIIAVIDGSATILTQADFVSADADGFTVNVSATSGGTLEVYYLAIGGSDVSNVKAGNFAISASTGDQAVTGVGFQPDSVILWGHRNSAGVPNSANASTSGALGFATATAQGYSGHRFVNSGAAADTAARQRTDQVFAYPLSTGVSAEGSMTSLDADGFTINWSDAGAGEAVFYLAVKGGQIAVGSFDQPTATGSQALTGVGFQPSALVLSSMNGVANVASFDHCRRSIGAASAAVAQWSMWSGTKDAADPTVARTYTSATKVVSMLTEGAGGTSVVNAEAGLTSFDSDGFTLDWTTADATQRQVIYWAIGASPTTPPDGGGGSEPSVFFQEFLMPGFMFNTTRQPIPGKRERLTVGAAVKELTESVYTVPNTDRNPSRVASAAVLQVFDNDIWFTIDGTDPSSTVGMLAAVGDQIYLDSTQKVRSFKAVRATGADGSIEVLPLWGA